MDAYAIDFYNLLPAVYRLRDAEQGYPLKALLDIIALQADILKRDMDGLWDDFFIETSRSWVVPYIGDLVGNNPLHEIARGRRADVAKTIYYRRRKGVLPMLEELARDVTGWGAHAVAAFEQLNWTQQMNHLRYEVAPNPQKQFPNSVTRVGSVNLRHMDAVDRADGPFDTLSHTVDVRPAGRVDGRYNIRKINFFLWRLEQFPLTAIPAKPSATFPEGFYFSILGNPAPLFNNPDREAAENEVATELHVPGPVRPAAFYFHPRDYYGPEQSFAVYRGAAVPENLVPRPQILCKDLSVWQSPPPGMVAIDVKTGRLAFAPGEAPATVSVYYNYGFSAEIGGGPYDRTLTLAEPDPDTLLIEVAKGTAVATIQAALALWEGAGKPPVIIRILDNQRYGGVLNIVLPPNGRLTVEAANGFRPHVHPVGGQWRISAPVGDDTDGQVTINGLLIEGRIGICGDLKLAVQHSTLVPGRMLGEDGLPVNPDLDSIVATDFPGDPHNCGDLADIRLTLAHTICGPLRLPAHCEGIVARDSIIDAPFVPGENRTAVAADDAGSEPGPPLTLERATVWGQVFVKSLAASDSIFNHPVRVQRLQTGCVRFCYVPPGSTTPQRYRCQPDLALAQAGAAAAEKVLARLHPTYTSNHYGDPGYAQLGWHTAVEILTGAENEAEMGVFNHLMQPQRKTNLHIRLEEYLPFGLEPGLIFVT